MTTSQLNKAEHAGLRELARTPLLLNLLCLTFDELAHFPERRVGLYEEALNALLVKWDSSRRIRRDEAYRQLDLGRKRHLLAYVAAATFGEGKYFVPETEMVGYILDYLKTIPELGNASVADGKAVLRAIEAQHGILVERARGIYGFAHLTFQEYFTAKYVVDAGEVTWNNLLRHYSEPQWREVFLLTTSLLSQADQFFERFSKQLKQSLHGEALLSSMLVWISNEWNPETKSVKDIIWEASSDIARILTASVDANPNKSDLSDVSDNDWFTQMSLVFTSNHVLALAYNIHFAGIADYRFSRSIGDEALFGLPHLSSLAKDVVDVVGQEVADDLDTTFESMYEYVEFDGEAGERRSIDNVRIDMTLIYSCMYGRLGMA